MLKIIAYTFLTIIISVGIFLSSAFFLSRITVGPEFNSKKEVPIYIITNGLHTDIVVPTKNDLVDWSTEIKYSNTISNDTSRRYLAIGFGNKEFYLGTPEWSDLKISVAFNAVFGFGTPAIHATFHDTMIEGDSCKKIMISKKQYARLVDYIGNSFLKSPDGHVINIDFNYDNFDTFYEARGNFNLLHTCNTWANNGLKSSGQKACLWTIFDTGIFLIYD